MQDVEGGKDYWGNPAIEMKGFYRSYREFSRLPETVKRIKRLERRLAALGEGESNDEEGEG